MFWTWIACSGAPDAPPTPPPAPELPIEEPPRERPDPAHQEAVRAELRARLGPAWDAPVPGLESALAGRGMAVYDEHCRRCHGDGGLGDGPDATPGVGDLTDEAWRGAYTEAGRVEIVRRGVPGTAMPGFADRLTEQQILDVFDFTRRLTAPDAPQ